MLQQIISWRNNINRTHLVGFFAAFVSAFLLFPTFMEVEVHPLQQSLEYTWLSLDPSWVVNLNYANLLDLKWGEEFAFTNGPLAYLTTRVGWGQQKFQFILFDIFIWLNFICIFFIHYVRSNNKILTLFLMASVGIMLPGYFGSGHALIMLIFLVFWIRESLDRPHMIAQIMQVLLVVLLFYIKFNTGLISLVFFAVAVLYRFFFTKQNKILVAIEGLTPFIIIFFTAPVFNVALWGYVVSGMEMVSGYNEIMYLDAKLENEFWYALVVIAILATIYVVQQLRNSEPILKKLLLFFLFGSTVFIIYKQAFIRADMGHVLEFFKYFPLLAFCFLQLHYFKKPRLLVLLSVVLIGLVGFVLQTRSNGGLNFTNKLSKTNYISDVREFTPTSGFKLFPNQNQLPSHILEKVNDNTVDSYPWNILFLLENRLNYIPRPVFQSYVAYTPYLENMNFQFYNSNKAPQFVFYDYDAIDYRYPLFDESKVNLTLLHNYKAVDSFTYGQRPILLLERKQNKKIIFTKSKEYAMYSDSPLIPEEGIYYEVYFYHTLAGRLKSILDYSPEISMDIKSGTGVTNYKTSKAQLEGGIFSSRHIVTTKDFHTLLQDGFTADERKVYAYYFKTEKIYFKDKIRVIEYKIEQK